MEFLENRLKNIEDRLSAIEARLNINKSIPIPPRPPLIEEPPCRTTLWLRANWLSLIGFALVLLAVSWFVGYAFTNNWLGETARIVLGVLTGFGAYIWGYFSLCERPRRGQLLVLLGGSIMILSIYAGYEFYSLLPASSAFILMSITTAITLAIALKYNNEGLGLISIIATMAIPLLIFYPNFNFPFLLSYVLAIDIIVLYIFIIRGWGYLFHAT